MNFVMGVVVVLAMITFVLASIPLDRDDWR